VTRSAAASLLENGADEAEVRAAIDERLRGELAQAVAGLRAEMEGPELEELAGAIGQFVGLVGQQWSQDGRKEFIGLATAELHEFPAGLVLDAVARARRRVHDGKLFIVWVCADVEPKVAKLDAEAERLERLARLALPAD
jgi:hypothetical protein